MKRRETGEDGPKKGDDPAKRGADPLAGAEGQEEALRAELARLRDLGEGLRKLTADAAKVSDPEALARIQDQNLAAFEAMVTTQGLEALDRMRAIVAELKDGAPPPAKGAATQRPVPMADQLAEAQMAIRAARKREMEKLLGRIGDRFRAAGSAAAENNKKEKD